jgi:uncharacterized membrane-anchored protein
VLLATMLGGCALDGTYRAEGPAKIQVAPFTRLSIARSLIYLPPDEGARLLRELGERPGAEVLGVVLTDEATPRMMILFAKSRDARGRPEVELVGWDEAPQARSFIEQLKLAERQRQFGDRARIP